MELDLVIRGGTVATAADVGKCHIGVKDGQAQWIGDGSVDDGRLGRRNNQEEKEERR